MYRRTYIKGVLFLALSILFIWESISKAYSATTDDLRFIIGERRISDEGFISDIKKVINQNQQTENTNELAELLNERMTGEYESTLNRLLGERDESLAGLEKSFSDNKPVEEILSQLGFLYSILSELGNLKEPKKYILDELYEDKPDLAYEYAKSVMAGIDNDFDIGQIGEGLQPPISNGLYLDKAYGMYIEVLESVDYKENTGIDLCVGRGKRVLSQFNGTIAGIIKHGNKYSVEISHGPELTSRYEFIEDIQVKKGQKIKQYDLIGYAASDTIHFEVILNTVPINPLFMYGGAGERAYKRWAAENPGMVYEETSFADVKKYVDDTVKPQVTIVPSMVVVDGIQLKLNFDDGYTRPEPPAIAFGIDELYGISGD